MDVARVIAEDADEMEEAAEVPGMGVGGGAERGPEEAYASEDGADAGPFEE